MVQVKKLLIFFLVVFFVVGGVFIVSYILSGKEYSEIKGYVVKLDLEKNELVLNNGKIVIIAGRYKDQYGNVYYPSELKIWSLLNNSYLDVKCYITEENLCRAEKIIVNNSLKLERYGFGKRIE